jgi:hypothetical protein
MASSFHTDYRSVILSAVMKYNATGTRTYNGSNALIIGADPWICLLDLATLWTADINASTDEVSGGSYARQQAVFAAVVAGTTDNDSNIDFTSMPACTVYSVGICATTTELTDDIIIGGDLTASKVVNAGDTFRIAAGDLDVTLT